jgi:hypothetical protein
MTHLAPVPPLPDDALVARLTARERAKPATLGALANVADSILGLFKSLRVRERLTDLEARLAAVEARPALAYCGPYEPGRGYQAGALVSKHGGLWLATAATSDTPGQGATAWRLIVNSGSA